MKRAEEIITLFDKTQQELSSEEQMITGKIFIGGMINKSIITAAAALREQYPEVSFDFYSGDATDVMQRLDHGILDFAVLLKPIDNMKYEYITLKDSSYWGLLMPKACRLAQKQFVEKEDLCSVPLIFHSRIGLQREITHWAQTDIEQMNIAATYNILSGNPLEYVRGGLGYLLTSSEYLEGVPDETLCFRTLDPALELSYALVWKRYAVMSRAEQAFFGAGEAWKRSMIRNGVSVASVTWYNICSISGVLILIACYMEI